MASNGELRVPIGIPVETDAGDAANSIAELRDRISASKDAIRDAAKQMGDLRGKTAEVVAAKDQLKAKLGQERAALADMTAGLVRQGTSFDQLRAKELAAAAAADKFAKSEDEVKKKSLEAAAAAKKAAKDQETAAKSSAGAEQEKHAAIGKALGAAGGPIGSIASKFDGLKDAMGGASGAELAFAAGAAALIGVILGIAATLAKATFELGKFILVSADAARTQHLLRAAALGGNESWAKALGNQVDELARKVPMARDQINQIGLSLAKNRVGGQTMVDTLNAVAQAASLLGDEAGQKIQDFVTRGRMMQNFRLNPQEMIGTGIEFDDVAKAYAASMHIGIDSARQALFDGKVKLADGAKALREAVEGKLGKLNLRAMMSFENVAKKAGEAFDALVKGVNLEPALEALQTITDLFSESTVTGRALKETVTRIGKGIVDAFVVVGPFAKAFVQGLIIGALKLETAYLQVRLKLQEAFGGSDLLKNVDKLGLALKVGEYALYAIGAAALMTVGFLAAVAAPFLLVAAAIGLVAYGIKSAFDFLLDSDWSGLATDLVDGFVDGIKAGLGKVAEAVGSLGTTAIKALKHALDSHSPSKKMFQIGLDTSAGYEGGVDAGAPAAQDAVGRMVDLPSSGGSGGGGRGGAVQVTFAPVINLQGGGGSVAEQLADPALLEPLRRLFGEVLLSAGLSEVPA